MRTWLRRLYEDLAAGRLGPTHHPVYRAAMDVLHVLVVLVRALLTRFIPRPVQSRGSVILDASAAL